MKISIITATYNSAATVEDTLRSVAMQDHPDIEHIIIDGASSDGTLQIVKRYPHVAKVLSEKDRGIYDAMNKGIAQASGDIIGILNSDDIYNSSSVLSNVAKAFAASGADAVYGDLQYTAQNDLNKIIRTWRAGPFIKKKFYFGWMPPHPTFFVRRNVYAAAGNFNLALRSSADYELMLRVLFKMNFRAAYVPQILVKMRAGGMSNATIRNRMRANREDMQAWRLNGLKPYFFTIPLKPLRKIFQFIAR